MALQSSQKNMLKISLSGPKCQMTLEPHCIPISTEYTSMIACQRAQKSVAVSLGIILIRFIRMVRIVRSL